MARRRRGCRRALATQYRRAPLQFVTKSGSSTPSRNEQWPGIGTDAAAKGLDNTEECSIRLLQSPKQRASRLGQWHSAEDSVDGDLRLLQQLHVGRVLNDVSTLWRCNAATC